MLATGAGAGFASGLLGIGGGFIMVPVSYWIIKVMGVPQDIAIRIAFGTSLLVILPTAISGTWRHNKWGVVHWKVVLVLGPFGLIGGFVGATLANYLSGNILEIGLGGLLLVVALWMGLGQRIMLKTGKEGREEKLPSSAVYAHHGMSMLWRLAVCGFAIGIVVGLSGMGGGVMIVPMLVMIFHFPIHIAIGTSLATIIFTSLGGIVGYIVHGIGMSPLPYSIGYVNLLIWLCMAAPSIPIAQLGAKTSHALPAGRLRYVFVAFLVYAALRMIGVF